MIVAQLSTASACPEGYPQPGHAPLPSGALAAQSWWVRSPKPWTLPTQPVTRALLAATGVSAEMINTQLRTGNLRRVRRGVFLAAGAWPADPAAQHLVLAHAEQVVAPDAVISRQSAAVVWGLPAPGFTPWHELPASVSLPTGTGYRARSNGTDHHVEQLPVDQLVRDPEGYTVTGLARTTVDLAADRPLPEALVLLDAAARLLCGSFVTSPRRSDFANPRLIEAARGQLADMARYRRRTGLIAAVGLADPRRESPAESLSAGHFHLAGLPEPSYQVPLRTPSGTLYPDCLWPEHRLIGECDGAVKYAEGSGAYVREKEREQVLRDLGYRMVRWLGKEIMARPQVVVDRVARALAA